MEIHYDPSFMRAYRKLPVEIINTLEAKVEIFKNDPWDPVLRRHSLRGHLRGFSAFSITYRYRAMFKIVEGRVVFVDIGTHDIYD